MLLSLLTEDIDADEGKELFHHILNRAFKLGETISPPEKSQRQSSTDYAGDTHSFISVKSEIPQQCAPRKKSNISIMDPTEVLCITSYLYHFWTKELR